MTQTKTKAKTKIFYPPAIATDHERHLLALFIAGEDNDRPLTWNEAKTIMATNGHDVLATAKALARCRRLGWLASTEQVARSTRVHQSVRDAMTTGEPLRSVPRRLRPPAVKQYRHFECAERGR